MIQNSSISIVKFVASLFILAPLAPSFAQSSAPSSELRLVATEFSFSPAAPLIVAGKVVTVVLDNSNGETEHVATFPALGLRIFARAGEISKHDYLFARPGEYEFFCDLPGHAEAGMKGKLSVVSNEGQQVQPDAAKR